MIFATTECYTEDGYADDCDSGYGFDFGNRYGGGDGSGNSYYLCGDGIDYGDGTGNGWLSMANLEEDGEDRMP